VIGGGKSGYYTMPREKINIFQALAMAGDVGMYGDRSRIRILRETDNGTIIKSFDVRSADIIHSEYFYIEPNDVIYIQTLNEQFFSITNLPSLFSTVISTFSFGVLIYILSKELILTIRLPNEKYKIIYHACGSCNVQFVLQLQNHRAFAGEKCISTGLSQRSLRRISSPDK
jgi:hypothetical protein